jgi:hypothetical protein
MNGHFWDSKQEALPLELSWTIFSQYSVWELVVFRDSCAFSSVSRIIYLFGSLFLVYLSRILAIIGSWQNITGN